MIRSTLSAILLTISINASAQTSIQRYYPQTPPTAPIFPTWYDCEMKAPVRTADKGYIFSAFPYIHSFVHTLNPIDTLTIKTDSSFVPQWKKPFYAQAIPLPTGGIILLYNDQINNVPPSVHSYIEKVTASGVQVFQKEFTGENIHITDGVLNGSTMRLVGRKCGSTGFPSFDLTSQPFSMEMDTTGILISQKIYSASAGTPFLEMTKIEKDTSGNYFCYGPWDARYASNMVLAKFSSSFTPLWSCLATSTSQSIRIEDIDVLPSGNIFACANTPNSMSTALLLKFSPTGSIITQKILENTLRISGLCKKSNGNYVVSAFKGNLINDSIVSIEVDTAFNIISCNYRGAGVRASTSFLQKNLLYTFVCRDFSFLLMSADTNGSNCAAGPVSYAMQTASIQTAGFTLTPLNGSATVTSSTVNIIRSQIYYDSCACIPFVNYAPNKVCLGSAAVFSVTGTGNVSWYSAKSGGTFLGPGNTYTFSQSTLGQYTVFVQDSACSVPNRLALTISVTPLPTLNVVSTATSICAGQTVTISVSGAAGAVINNTTIPVTAFNTYTIAVTPSVTTVYTITGSNAPSCTDTKTYQINVTPFPTLSVNYSNQFPCAGQSVTITVSGAQTYSWSNGSVASTTVLTPPAGSYIYTITGYNGACTKTVVALMLVQNAPAISVSSNPAVLCIGNQATLTANGGSSYQWSTQGSGSSVTVSPVATTIYTVVGSSASNTCTTTKTLQVNVAPLPTIAVNASDSSVCSGKTISLNASGASIYSWNNGLPNGTSHVVSPATTSQYVVTGTSSNNCVSSSSLLITVFATPTLTISPPQATICAGAQLILSVSGANSYTWSNTTFTNVTVVSPPTNTFYTVSGSSAQGCVGSGTAFVSVQLCTFEEEFKNCNATVFPNPLDDHLTIKACSVPVIYEIVSPTGDLIFEGTSDKKEFTVLFSALPSGLYTIVVKSPGYNSTFKTVKN